MQRVTGPTPMMHHDDCIERYDLDELLHPANAFAHPSEVVNDPDLTLSEKRAIPLGLRTPALSRPPQSSADGREKRRSLSMTSWMPYASSTGRPGNSIDRTISAYSPSGVQACLDANRKGRLMAGGRRSTENSSSLEDILCGLR
jgi:hypothetical protein